MWYIVSEFIYDLANALLRYIHWDAKGFSFDNKDSIPKPKVVGIKLLAKALSVDILVDADDRGKVFYYIDDLISVGLFTATWHRLAYVVAVIIDVFAHPVHPFELIHRDHLLSMKKLFAKGSLEESKIILG